MSTTLAPSRVRTREKLDQAVIRFCGDSGDGMQITGSQFTNTVALYGNDLATLPDYPAEIRAPAGTLPGVSGFQVHFSSHDVYTPGDSVDALIAMNPAALKTNLADLKPNGILIVNIDDFGETDLRKAHMTVNPLEDHSLDGYRLFPVGLDQADARRAEGTRPRRQERGPLQEFLRAGHVLLALQPLDGYDAPLDRGQIQDQAVARRSQSHWPCRRATAIAKRPKRFRSATKFRPPSLRPASIATSAAITALAMGFVAASQKAGLPLFLGSYPITPASDILHELSIYKNFGVITFQAEDEIAAITSAIGAAYAGALGAHHDFRPRHGAEDRSDGPRRRGRIAARDLRHPARRPVHRPCRRKPSRPICCRRSSAETPKRRFRFLRRRRPAIASGSRSKPAASRSSTWCRSLFFPTATWRTAPSRGAFRRSTEMPEIPVHFETNPIGLPALSPRSRDARASLGDSRHAGTRAPHRRHRKAGRHRQRQLRAAEPRDAWFASAPQRSQASCRTFRTSFRRATPRRSADRRPGARRTARSPRR